MDATFNVTTIFMYCQMSLKFDTMENTAFLQANYAKNAASHTLSVTLIYK